MTIKSETPIIESIPFKDLIVDLVYSGRSKKEILANAKELAPQLANGWDAAQPGQYFIGEDGKKTLIAGFTRMEAAKLNDLKAGYFVQTNGDAITHLTACLRTNSGKPISRRAQGEVFAALEKGVVAGDFAGAIADPKSKKDWKRMPLSHKEIGELPGVGKTSEHVRQCIMIVESSPEVSELIENDQVALNIVIAAKSLAKDDDGKQLRILKKAIANAREDGKDKATQKHFDAIKDEFKPVKKLKAEDGKESKDKKDGKDATENEQKGTQDASGGKNKGEDAEERSEETTQEQQTLPIEPQSPVRDKDARKALITLITQWCERTSNVLADDEIEELAQEIIDAKLPI